jgi:hypothetical protein
MARSRHSWLAAAILAPLLLAACGGGGVAAKPSAQPTTGPMADTWTWNGDAWSMAAGGKGPAARFMAAFAFDTDRHQAILFGGAELLDQFDDTWSWDGKAWTQLHPAHHPGALSSQLMAYDEARRQLVLFGGFHGLEASEGIPDTWTWDGQDWTLRASVGPKVRSRQAMAFDPSLGKVILFGGNLGVNDWSDETWAWDGQAWTRLMPGLRPTQRSGVALAWDGAGKALLLFGGAVSKDAGNEAGVPIGETWAFSKETWTKLAPALEPTGRADATMAYDAHGKRLILFGGNACPFRSETWAWDGTTWKLLRPSRSPAPRTQAAMAADPAGHALVLFGGLADTPCL